MARLACTTACLRVLACQTVVNAGQKPYINAGMLDADRFCLRRRRCDGVTLRDYISGAAISD
jgi:hypothetical protein